MVTFDFFFAFYVVGSRRNYLVEEKEGDLLWINLFFELCPSIVPCVVPY
jgi:hypothetical protein